MSPHIPSTLSRSSLVTKTPKAAVQKRRHRGGPQGGLFTPKSYCSFGPTPWTPNLPPLPGTDISGTCPGLLPHHPPLCTHCPLPQRYPFPESCLPLLHPHSPRSVPSMPTTFSKQVPFPARDNGHHLLCRKAARQGGRGLRLSCGRHLGPLGRFLTLASPQFPYCKILTPSVPASRLSRG